MRAGVALATLLDEAVSGLVRARRMTGVSILVIAVSLLLVGAFLLAAENLRGLAEAVRGETAVTVFLRPGATDADRAEIARIARESRLAAKVTRVTPDEARARFSTWFRSLAAAAATLPTNPFPESLEIVLAPDAAASAALPGLLENLAAQRAAEEVQFDLEWVRRLRGAVGVARAAGGAFAVVLVLGAAFTIANVVRLTILLHREEIDILRLVGAPEFLIRGPFVVGGLLQGLLGGLLALGLLGLAYRALLAWGGRAPENLVALLGLRFLPPASAALLVGGGVAAGLLGGLIAVRRRNVG
ncbi:MAG TPA: permease-like cell division protein FtsX [Thermoanaerobaculia bacterium]|nr:permease-like cell division protein FtsX [Thermoanaerobaculia bacterium]HQR67642.1 permease-like cell division protein FtsX [Thermoanaerobaculia bacterium]